MLLVILEHENGELVEAAKEALTFGRTLAEKMDDDLEAALIGSDDDDLVEAAGEYGAETVHTCTHEVLRDYGPDAHAAVVVQMIDELSPDAVLACGSDRGNERETGDAVGAGREGCRGDRAGADADDRDVVDIDRGKKAVDANLMIDAGVEIDVSHHVFGQVRLAQHIRQTASNVMPIPGLVFKIHYSDTLF